MSTNTQVPSAVLQPNTMDKFYSGHPDFFVGGRPLTTTGRRALYAKRRKEWSAVKTQMDQLHDTRLFLGNNSETKKNDACPFPVDVVFTWVDMTEKHKRKMRSYIHGTVPSDNSINRYTDNGELKYAIRSVYKHLSWVRHIFVVCDDDQFPAWLDDHSAKQAIPVVVVPHSYIYPNKSHLPTFNSQSIECHLHRIPGLAERFIYFNDDMFVGRELSWRVLFTEDGRPLYTLGNPLPIKRWGETHTKHMEAWWNNQRILRSIAPHYHSVRFTGHQAMPMTKRGMQLLWDSPVAKQFLTATSASRFRDSGNVYAIGLVAHLQLIRELAQVSTSAVHTFYSQVHTGTDFTLIAASLVRRPQLFCINDGFTNRSKIKDPKRNFLQSMLHIYFPEKSPAEK